MVMPLVPIEDSLNLVWVRCSGQSQHEQDACLVVLLPPRNNGGKLVVGRRHDPPPWYSGCHNGWNVTTRDTFEPRQHSRAHTASRKRPDYEAVHGQFSEMLNDCLVETREVTQNQNLR